MVFQKIFIPSQQDSQCPTLLVLIAEFFASLSGGVWGDGRLTRSFNESSPRAART